MITGFVVPKRPFSPLVEIIVAVVRHRATESMGGTISAKFNYILVCSVLYNGKVCWTPCFVVVVLNCVRTRVVSSVASVYADGGYLCLRLWNCERAGGVKNSVLIHKAYLPSCIDILPPLVYDPHRNDVQDDVETDGDVCG
jgi:hypothetical protein